MLPIFYGTQPQTPDRHQVVAHTPDPTKYHTQGGATMIPRHTQFGASRGFDVRAGIVRLVDIDCDDTPGTLIDVEKLNSKEVSNALLNNDGDPHTAMLHLGAEQGYKVVYGPFTKVQQVEQRINTEKQGYVVPKADLNGNQYKNDAQFNFQGGSVTLPRTVPAPIQAPPAPGTQPAFVQPAPMQQAPVPVAPQYSGPDPMMMQMFQMLQQQLQQQAAALAALSNQTPAPPVPVPEPVRQEPEPTAAGGAVKASVASQIRPRPADETSPRRSAEQAIDAFTEEIGLPYLTADPSKPKHQVVFHLSEVGGDLRAWYHDVTVTGRCLTLTYDNRYDGGTQFVPPYLGAQKTITIEVPRLGKKFTVFSGDFKTVVGPLDQCLLVITDTENLEQAE